MNSNFLANFIPKYFYHSTIYSLVIFSKIISEKSILFLSSCEKQKGYIHYKMSRAKIKSKKKKKRENWEELSIYFEISLASTLFFTKVSSPSSPTSYLFLFLFFCYVYSTKQKLDSSEKFNNANVSGRYLIGTIILLSEINVLLFAKENVQ